MGKHHFVRIGSVLVLFALAIRCDALLWDFNEKAQENDWKVIGGTGGGGRNDFAQAGGNLPEKIEKSFQNIIDSI